MSDFPQGRAFDFPSNPSIGDTVALPDGTTYVWDGIKWSILTAGGMSLVRYEYHQTTPDQDWVIAHNLNFRYVHVQIVDGAGNTVIADVTYTNPNRADIWFANPVAGTAILRR